MMSNLGINSNKFSAESIIDIESAKIWARQQEAHRKHDREQLDAGIAENKASTKRNLVLITASIVGTVLVLVMVTLLFGAKLIFGLS